MHLFFILIVITSLKCVFSATLVCSETAQGMAVERHFPWGVWQIFSQKALKVGNILEKFLGLESDPEFCRLRNWTLSAHESNFFSQELAHIRHVHGNSEQNPNALISLQ